MDWTLHTRRTDYATSRTEAICPHGVGHHKGVHGCHGEDGKSCCESCPKEIWDKVSKD